MFDNELLTPDECARLYRVSPRTIRKWLKTGIIDGGKVGGVWRAKRASVEKLLTSRNWL